jgi:hypothetical protein
MLSSDLLMAYIGLTFVKSSPAFCHIPTMNRGSASSEVKGDTLQQKELVKWVGVPVPHYPVIQNLLASTSFFFSNFMNLHADSSNKGY